MFVAYSLLLLHILAGWSVTVRLWRPTRLSDAPALVLLTAFATYYAVPVLLGWVTGWMNMGIIGLGTAAAIAFAGWSWFRSRTLPPAFSLAQLRESLRAKPWIELALWTSIAFLSLALLWHASNLPIRVWDARDYHSINALRWAETGRFELRYFEAVAPAAPEARAEVWPNLKAVLPFIILRTTGSELATATTQWPFLLFAFAALLGIGRRIGLPGWGCAIAAWFLLGAPEVLLQTQDAYADVMFCSAQLLCGLLLLARWQERAGPYATRLGQGPIPLAFALLTGAKPTGLLAAGVLGTAYIALLLRESWREGFPVAARRTALAVAMVVAVAIAASGAWYSFGLREYGNPLYPVRVQLGDRVLLKGIYSTDINNFYLQRYTGKTGLAAWWNGFLEVPRLPTLSAWSSGYGAHSAVLGFAALGVFAALIPFGTQRGPRLQLLAMLLLLAAGSTALAVPRFSLFLVAGMGLAFAWILWISHGFLRAPIAVVFVALLGFNLERTLPSLPYRTRSPILWAFPQLTGHYRSTMIDDFPDGYGSLDWWRDVVGGEGRVLAIEVPLSPWVARSSSPGDDYRIVSRPVAGGEAAWAEAVAKSGATHLLAAYDSPAFEAARRSPEHFRLAFRRVESHAIHAWAVRPREDAALFEIRKQGAAK